MGGVVLGVEKEEEEEEEVERMGVRGVCRGLDHLCTFHDIRTLS